MVTIITLQLLSKLDICMKKKIDPNLTPYIEINSSWIIDLKTKSKTIKLLDHNIGELTLVADKDFLHKTQTVLIIMKKKLIY